MLSISVGTLSLPDLQRSSCDRRHNIVTPQCIGRCAHPHITIMNRGLSRAACQPCYGTTSCYHQRHIPHLLLGILRTARERILGE